MKWSLQLCGNHSTLSWQASDISPRMECVLTLSRRSAPSSRRMGAYLRVSHSKELLGLLLSVWLALVRAHTLLRYLADPLWFFLVPVTSVSPFKADECRADHLLWPPCHPTHKYSDLQVLISEGLKRFVSIWKALWHSLRQYSVPLEGSIIVTESQHMHFSFYLHFSKKVMLT